MSVDYYWRVQRINNGNYEYVYSINEPTTAPSDGGSIVTSKTCAILMRGRQTITTGALILESSLSSTQAIKISATATAGGMELNTGTGGLALGCGSNTGGVRIGDAASAKTITIGNSTGASRVVSRNGTGGRFLSQLGPSSMTDASQTATATQLISGIMYMTATANRTITLPAAASLVSTLSGVAVNDSFEFTVVQNGTGLLDPIITLAMGTGGSSIGSMIIAPATNTLVVYRTSGCGRFRLRFTNVTTSSEAYEVYRVG